MKKTEKKYRHHLPQYVALSVFLICMAALWPGMKDTTFDQQTFDLSWSYWIAGAYTLICLGFLLFQLYAFARSHLVYDEDIEEIKMDVFYVEDYENGKKIEKEKRQYLDSFYHS